MTNILTDRYTQALDLARTLHTETRKGGEVPYLAHLLSVSALVLEHGGTEDQAIAALLHDSAEDHGGEARIAQLRTQFGDTVADIVLACSDSLTVDKDNKQPWWPRKIAYVDALVHERADALLVSAADKVHNARSILADYRTHGDQLWARFNPAAGRTGSLWYYARLVQILGERLAGTPGAELAAELRRTVEAIHAEATARGHDVPAELAAALAREQVERARGPHA
ncbi:MAG: HD domain-containing protein [Actinomycetota bacterium]|nr:HD domain-containing protein [Actinomycetota bacterium]